jgi:hypothetical protein
LSNNLIRTLADAATELGYSDCARISTKLPPEATGLATLKSGVDAVTSCIEALSDRRELILMKPGKCDSNEFVIASSTLSSFVLTLQAPSVLASSLVLFLVLTPIN